MFACAKWRTQVWSLSRLLRMTCDFFHKVHNKFWAVHSEKVSHMYGLSDALTSEAWVVYSEWLVIFFIKFIINSERFTQRMGHRNMSWVTDSEKLGHLVWDKRRTHKRPILMKILQIGWFPNLRRAIYAPAAFNLHSTFNGCSTIHV